MMLILLRQSSPFTMFATVEKPTVTSNAVTIRDRDTMEQVRVPISELMDTLTERLDR